MYKVSLFSGQTEYGPLVVPLFGPADSFFEKTASLSLLPEVTNYIATLRPSDDSQYVLVNAMGAGEYYGSNVNGDHFPEAALIHRPDDWAHNHLLDQIKAKDWPYGFPTFYNAQVFAHHRNKDMSRGFGGVELAAWNPHMKRVELITRLDRDKCLSFGGQGVWDKLKSGHFPDVSMGTRVPFDCCFPAGTLVRTTEGHKPIEEVVGDDKVLTHTGSIRTVVATMERTTDLLIRIRTTGLPEITATDNHPFLVLRREQVRTCKGSANGQRLRHSFDGSDQCRRCGDKPNLELVWAAAETLRPGDYLAVPAKFERTSVQDVSLPRARLLGYYLGDGHIIKQRSGRKKDGPYKDMGVSFSVNSERERHLDNILNTIVESGAVNEPHIYEAGCGRKAHTVNVYDQELAAWLQQYGGRTSRGKFLNEEVFSWGEEAKLALVAAYIDTDGSFDETSGHVRIASVNRGLLLDVQRLLLSVGIPSSLGVLSNGGGYGGSSICWHVHMSAWYAQKFLGKATRVKKKEVSWPGPQSFFWGDYWFVPVKAVEEEETKARVFNISVEGDESYVAEGAAVHNCSICLDWKAYKEAWRTFDSKVHKHPGEAILSVHKKNPIRGLSITRRDYCEHARHSMNTILPDGRKVWVYNDFPRFFDISYVFIGADKIAKAMLKIADAGRVYSYVGSAALAEKVAFDKEAINDLTSRTISDEEWQKFEELVGMAERPWYARSKLASSSRKQAEIKKTVVPSQFAQQAVPLLTKNESDLPKELLATLGAAPIERALATLTGMGIVLRPREFQRIFMLGMGARGLADELDDRDLVFPKVDEVAAVDLAESGFHPILARLLRPFMRERSAFGPYLEHRVVILGGGSSGNSKEASSHPAVLLRKIGAAYNGYRQGLMQLISSSQVLLEKAAGPKDSELLKLAAAQPDELFTPLSFCYLHGAFMDELPVGYSLNGVVNINIDKQA